MLVNSLPFGCRRTGLYHSRQIKKSEEGPQEPTTTNPVYIYMEKGTTGVKPWVRNIKVFLGLQGLNSPSAYAARVSLHLLS